MGLTQSCIDEPKQIPHEYRVLVIGANLNRFNKEFLKRFHLDYIRPGFFCYLTETGYVTRCHITASMNRTEVVDTIKFRCGLSWDEIHLYGMPEEAHDWVSQEWKTTAVYSIPPWNDDVF
jgi:hypothetical protein